MNIVARKTTQVCNGPVTDALIMSSTPVVTKALYACGGGNGKCRLHSYRVRQSQGLQVLDEVGLLCGCKLQPKQPIVVLDDRQQIGGAPVVEIRSVLLEPP